MIYGELSFRDRLLRGAIGVVLGGGAAFLLMVRGIMLGGYSHPTLVIPATLLGAAIGGVLAFRRKRIAS